MASAAVVRKYLSQNAVTIKTDADRGEVTAVVNTTGIRDKQQDTMVPGCWRKVIAEGQQVAICLSHDVTKIVGKVTSLVELSPGDPRIPSKAGNLGKAGALLMTGALAMATQAGRETFALLKGGFLNLWSVQFTVAQDEPDGRGGRQVKLVDELFEVSPVLVAASPGTGTLRALSRLPLTERETLALVKSFATSYEPTGANAHVTLARVLDELRRKEELQRYIDLRKGWTSG